MLTELRKLLMSIEIMEENLFMPYTPGDKSTWFSEVDHITKVRTEKIYKKQVRRSDNSLDYSTFWGLCDEFVKAMLECMTCIHLYSTSGKIAYWKERIIYYSTFLASVNIKPPRRNSVNYRKVLIKNGYSGNIDEQKGSLLKSINDVKKYVDVFSESGETDPEEQIISCEECYRLCGKKMIDTVKKIGVYIAKQQPREIEKLMEKY